MLFQFPLMRGFLRAELPQGFFWPLLRNIRLHFGYDETSRKAAIAFLPVVEDLLRRGKLRRIELTLHGLGTMSGFGKMVDGAEELDEMRELLSAVNAVDDSGRLYKRLIITIDQHLSSITARKEWFNTHSVEKTEAMLFSLHGALGGEVILNNVLCYAGGKCVRKRFKELLEETEREYDFTEAI